MVQIMDATLSMNNNINIHLLYRKGDVIDISRVEALGGYYKKRKTLRSSLVVLSVKVF